MPRGQADTRLSVQGPDGDTSVPVFSYLHRKNRRSDAIDWSVSVSMIASHQLRQQLVESLRERGLFGSDVIARAFLTVPREAFVPGVELESVYKDRAITTKREAGVPVSSSSQPAMMATMLRQLEVQPGMRVLEIGAGTGYNAALLQELTGESGRVTSLEIDAEVASWATQRLRQAGYNQVEVIETDGGLGWAAGAPYDRIELTVGTAEIAPAWVDQLAPGGILVVPLWVNTVQLCIALVKESGRLQSRSAVACGFTRIRGCLAGADRFRVLQPKVMIASASAESSDDVVRQAVTSAPLRESVDGASLHGFSAFMALHDASTVMVSSDDELVTGFGGTTFGLADSADQSLCLVGFPMEQGSSSQVYSYNGTRARERVMRLLDSWQSAGSPRVSDFEISVHPLSANVPLERGASVVDTAHWHLVFRVRGH